MDALISLVYTIIDSVCVCLFLDAFASHRWRLTIKSQAPK